MCTDKRPSEYTARRWLSVNQEKRTQEKPALPTLWSWTSITQNWENKFLLCRPFRKIGIVHICYSHIGFWNTRILGSLEECNFTCLSSCSRGDSPHLELWVESAGFSRRCMGMSVSLRVVPSSTGLPSKRCPGRGVLDGEHTCAHGWFMSMYVKNHYNIV